MKNYISNEMIRDYAIQARLRFNQTNISPDLADELEKLMGNIEQFDARQFDHFKLEEIFEYLKVSHQYYLQVWIPKLENTMLQLYAKMSKDYWSVSLLTLFLNSYKKELTEHIEQEEKVLFVFVDKLLEGKECEGLRDLVLNHFIHTHNDNVVIQLDELKKDLLTFDHDLENNLIVEVLFNQLTLFQHDLLVHGLIEDNIFVAKVVAFSNQRFDTESL